MGAKNSGMRSSSWGDGLEKEDRCMQGDFGSLIWLREIGETRARYRMKGGI